MKSVEYYASVGRGPRFESFTSGHCKFPSMLDCFVQTIPPDYQRNFVQILPIIKIDKNYTILNLFMYDKEGLH